MSEGQAPAPPNEPIPEKMPSKRETLEVLNRDGLIQASKRAATSLFDAIGGCADAEETDYNTAGVKTVARQMTLPNEGGTSTTLRIVDVYPHHSPSYRTDQVAVYAGVPPPLEGREKFSTKAEPHVWIDTSVKPPHAEDLSVNDMQGLIDGILFMDELKGQVEAAQTS